MPKKKQKEAAAVEIQRANREFRDLPVTLSKDEMWERNGKLVKLATDMEALIEEKRRISAEIGEQIKQKKKKYGELLQTLRTGVERQEIMCEWRHNAPDKKMELYRMDTGEFLIARELSIEEQQMHIPF